MFRTTGTSHFDDQWNHNLEQNILEIKTSPRPRPPPKSNGKMSLFGHSGGLILELGIEKVCFSILFCSFQDCSLHKDFSCILIGDRVIQPGVSGAKPAPRLLTIRRKERISLIKVKYMYAKILGPKLNLMLFIMIWKALHFFARS